MKRKTAVGFAFLLALSLAGCAVSGEGSGYLVSPDETYETVGASQEDYRLTDRDALYEEDDGEVVTMYLTVGKGNKEDGTDHTWTEVNSYPLEYYEENDLEPYKCEAVLQVGDEAGPVDGEFGSADRTANATVSLRGSGASTWQQKSYRIKIKSGSGDWRDQKTISLNKHAADPVRFKNRLAYSLMTKIPQMLSCRTTFVHLYVKDKTQGEDGPFRDYGLYTQVEQVNKTYLRNRGFDSDGQLYKAGRDFDWERHEDVIMAATDENYDKERFEQYLEIGGSEEHEKIMELLDAVNDPDLPIDQVVERYFDQENLYYWMAFHILTGNKDVLEGNYYLYSSRGSDKWYFISWDNDGILKEGYEKLGDTSYDRSWNKGIFPFVDTVLFQRILKNDVCRQALDAAVEDLYAGSLSQEAIQKEIDQYKETVKDYLYVLPDQTYARVSEENYEILADSMAKEAADNYSLYQESKKSPWPFHILDPVSENGKIVLTWEQAYLHGDGEVSYAVDLARDYTLENSLVSAAVNTQRMETDALLPGQYFVRVRALSDGGISQDAYEYYQTEAGPVCHSTLCFYVQEDGSVQAARFGEDG